MDDDEIAMALLANQLVIMELLVFARIEADKEATVHATKRIEATTALLDRLRQQQQYKHK
jgi:hypothetical protein